MPPHTLPLYTMQQQLILMPAIQQSATLLSRSSEQLIMSSSNMQTSPVSTEQQPTLQLVTQQSPTSQPCSVELQHTSTPIMQESLPIQLAPTLKQVIYPASTLLPRSSQSPNIPPSPNMQTSPAPTEQQPTLKLVTQDSQESPTSQPHSVQPPIQASSTLKPVIQPASTLLPRSSHSPNMPLSPSLLTEEPPNEIVPSTSTDPFEKHLKFPIAASEGSKTKALPKKMSNIKCNCCEDELISDVEEDGEKNIGCDSCIRWYHLKCTSHSILSYNEAAKAEYEYELCQIARVAKENILNEYCS
ncbi:hypothetical protein ACJJTC_004896 [Scirpophaga incertulas]